MKKKKIFRVINLIKNIICWTLVVIIVFTLVIFFTSRINGSTPSVFGYSIFRVSSGSMEPELMVGDIILDKEVENPEDLKVGDVITFRSDDLGDMLVTHKIIKVSKPQIHPTLLKSADTAALLRDKNIMIIIVPMAQ